MYDTELGGFLIERLDDSGERSGTGAPECPADQGHSDHGLRQRVRDLFNGRLGDGRHPYTVRVP